MYGESIGSSNIVVFDIDHDGHQEMILGNSQMWYVVKQSGPDIYTQTWFSNPSSSSIMHIEVADVDADNIGEIFVGSYDGKIEIYKGSTMEWVETITVSPSLRRFILADVDSDSALELLTIHDTGIRIYSISTHQLEWSTAGKLNSKIAVGNVDADAAPEIVISSGYVIDGVSHQLEWTYPVSGGFGAQIEVGDLDGDGMEEIYRGGDLEKNHCFRC